MKKIVQKIVLAGFIVRSGKVLILQRGKEEESYPNIWELPSGRKEPLESSEAALLREIKEESGLDVRIICPFSVFNYQIEKEDEICDSTQISFIVVPIVDGEAHVVLSSEHQAFAWISKEEIDRYDITDATKEVMRRGFEILPKI